MPLPTDLDEFSIPDDEAEEIIEAMLFAAGYPLEYAKISEIIAKPVKKVEELVDGMENRFRAETRGIQIVRLEDSVQLCTKEKYDDYVREALGIHQRGKLSNSSLEVLAIIAYNQPITKAVIEQIRGVDSGYAIAVLSEKSLIEVKGKLDVPGRPNLYGTTPDFLRVFGIEKLDDLPDAVDEKDGEQVTIEGI